MSSRAPHASYEYAEAVLSRNFSLQAGTASYFATGALTALTVFLAIFSLIVSLAAQRGNLPTWWILVASTALATLAGIMLLIAWSLCNLKTEVNPVRVSEDLVTRGVPEAKVRQAVVSRMSVSYLENTGALNASLVLIVASIPFAVAGISLLIYGTLN